MKADFEKHLEWFENYAAAKMAGASRDPAPLALKREHSLNVLDNAREIALAEGWSGERKAALELAALYHDLGRFDQYLIHGTFRDRESLNHASLGVRILKKEGVLAAESPAVRKTILGAIALHNRARLPRGLEPGILASARALRDADKLDILRVMAERLAGPGPHDPTVILSLPDDPELCGEEVIRAALAGKTASYEDLRSLNDFRVLLGAWLFDMNFESSREAFRKRGQARELVAALPRKAPYAAVRKKLLDLLA